MANFVRGIPGNAGYNEKYTSAEFNLTDAQWPNAVNGGGGSTHTPSDFISFLGTFGFVFECPMYFGAASDTAFDAGASVSFQNGSTANFNSGASLTVESSAAKTVFNKDVDFGNAQAYRIIGGSAFGIDATSALTCVGALDIFNSGYFHIFSTAATPLIESPNFVFDNSSPIIRNGGLLAIEATAADADIRCPNFIFNGSSPVVRNGGNLSIEATCALSVIRAPVTFYSATSTLFVENAAVLNILPTAGTSLVQAPLEHWSTLTMKGTAGRLQYRYVFGGNADHQYGPANTGVTITPADIVIVKTGTLTAARKYIADQTNCTGGEVMTFTNEDFASHALTITQANGSTNIAVLTSGAGGYRDVTILNDGLGNTASSWHIIGATGVSY